MSLIYNTPTIFYPKEKSESQVQIEAYFILRRISDLFLESVFDVQVDVLGRIKDRQCFFDIVIFLKGTTIPVCIIEVKKDRNSSNTKRSQEQIELYSNFCKTFIWFPECRKNAIYHFLFKKALEIVIDNNKNKKIERIYKNMIDSKFNKINKFK